MGGNMVMAADAHGAVRFLRERANAYVRKPGSVRRLAFGRDVDAALATVDASVPDPFGDLSASQAVGTMHWIRYHALPPGADQAERDLMAFWVGAVELSEPGRVGTGPTKYFSRYSAACAVAEVAAVRVRDGHAGAAADTFLDTVVGHLSAIREDTHWECHSRAVHLAYLAQLHVLRVERGDATSAAKAVEAARTATQVLAADDTGLHMVRIAHASALMMGLRVGGTRADLDEAIESWGELIDTWPRASAGELPGAFNNLAIARRIRAELTGSRSDLDEAIRVHRRCLGLLSKTHPLRPYTLALLANALRLRYENLGHREDLDELLAFSQEAVSLPVTSREMAGLTLSHLSMAHHTRYGRTADPADLDAAVNASRTATEVFGRGSADRAVTLANHSRLLQLRAQASGTTEDIEAALTAADTALAELRAAAIGDILSQPVAGTFLNRCNALLTRAESTGSTADATAALEAAEQVLSHCPSGSWLYAAGLHAVGNAHRLTAESLAATGAREADRAAAHARADHAYRLAAAHPSADSVGAALATAALGSNAARAGNPSAAADAYAEAVARLKTVAPSALRRADQEARLTALRGLASDALACCLDAGRTSEGVLLFEQGRGVILRQALAARTDLTELSELAPELAERLHVLQSALSAPEEARPAPGNDIGARIDPLSGLLAGVADPVERRRLISAEIDVVVGRIRAEAALPDFRVPPDLARLSGAAGENGAIVVVNVSRLRSDAVLLRAGRDPEVVRLPRLTPAFAADRTQRLGRALETALAPDTFEEAAAEAAEEEIDEILGDLWDAVTGPVLDALGHRARASGPLSERPRVWWCPAGALSALPLHAAGRTDTLFDDDPFTVPDRVVSSYTPTLDSLLPVGSPTREARRTDEPVRTLVVATATAPGVSADAERPDTLVEADTVTRLAAGPVERLIGPNATRENVETALKAAHRVHFACHADTDPNDPAAGQLRLADHATRPFDVTAISALRLTDAEFAFLAACSTAAPGLRNPDEAVHLVSGFRLAGFQQVIGTLWPLLGEPALSVVRDVHKAVAADGPTVAADALHEAVLGLRSGWSDRPSVWACLLHVGGLEPAASRKDSM
ncbi:CHAT domain-containing protein [Streptomyces sp. NPDC057939]|uniref:CHAT domain-containing protein n=1 Tax=Streptomyces sp. NPDC057939 TaxID=3346284 RepID=UPI0036E4FCB6